MVRTADFDQDGDLDVVVASFDLIAWYENLDGLGEFSDAIPIQEGKGQSFSLCPADFNNDGHIDLVVSFFDADEVQWHHNLGDGTFVNQLLDFGLLIAGGVSAADLDGDDGMDIVLGVTNGNGLYWIENLDGLGTFGTRIVINASISQSRAQAIGDIDGDMDILTNSNGSSYLSWYENVDGLGSFANQHIIDPLGLYENYVYLFDINGDGDLDVLSAALSNQGRELVWHENLTILGVEDNDLENRVSIYPNPVQNKLIIESDLAIYNVSIFDLVGRLVLEEKESVNQIDLSAMTSSVFLVKIET